MLAYGARRTYWDMIYHMSGSKIHVDKQVRCKASARQAGNKEAKDGITISCSP